MVSATGNLPKWGALTVGGAAANDDNVIPKDEAFFDYDKGWELRGRTIVRGVEIDHGQHW